MDHNLEDSLNLDSAMGMDFENVGDVVVSQADISLDASACSDGGMQMEFQHMEEQSVLMDTGHEEIIDFMGDQFALQEYSVQDDQTTSATTTEESNQNILTQSDPLLDLQFETQTVAPMKQAQPKFIPLKQATGLRASSSEASPISAGAVAAPRAVAIAPKPARAVAIAPRPVALVSNKSLVKKLPLAGVINAGTRGNTVLAQIGKQLVMMPHNTPKIKLVTSGSSGVPNFQYIKANTSQAQVINTKNVTSVQSGKQIMAKVIVQGQSSADQSNQQTIITKILPATNMPGSCGAARYVMQQKTVPISLGNKVLLASPTKQGPKFTKKQQVISVKSPTPKLMPAPLGATKKAITNVTISSNPLRNVILKTTAPPKTAQITKDGKVVVQGQRSQIHQINVPGKGIQYIRLITNPTASTTKSASKTSVQSHSAQPKSFVLTDAKGKLIQMSSEKSVSSQPPPLSFTVSSGNTAKPSPKWQQKFVRIASAPAAAKNTTATTSSARSSQSLLAPLSPLAVKLEETSSDCPAPDQAPESQGSSESESESEPAAADPKASLRTLIADAVGPTADEEAYSADQQDSVQGEQTDSVDPESQGQEEHPLIVIPANYIKPDPAADEYAPQAAVRTADNSGMMMLDEEAANSLQEPTTPPTGSEYDVTIKSDFMRPRRACNCTKSQCLKLYCDCFANGEFCNRCNCNNCYNNLNYEELRQKAIRACLERNPNAFRPKIGKTKAGGPEIIRRHNKGCNCKRSGCLKNYCECYEAKIACTAMCKCFGCRNVEETLHRRRQQHALYRPPPLADLKSVPRTRHKHTVDRQPCSFMTTEVIEAVCQCLLAASVEGGGGEVVAGDDAVSLVLDEFSRCLQDIISASHHAPSRDDGHS
ncbi:protein lin-54 homolog isoform X3 [Ostrinia furnacalis]|uniref:protein lin-54 homolog isoform X3 n=1 Tax=Ostrinia furnacalis TaxID=93504 RepID=UPI00103CB995|nr:protein lin-54 homolog isoform X3 [Ostrinia furnacalis]